MEESVFKQKLHELVQEIKNLPESEREKLNLLTEETKRRHTELKKTVTNLQESIDFLRLSIKYLLFDLEATRRENSYLRKVRWNIVLISSCKPCIPFPLTRKNISSRLISPFQFYHPKTHLETKNGTKTRIQ